MAAAPQQGGGNQGDNSAGILWGIAAIFAAIGAFWYVFKSYIVGIYLEIKLLEVHLFNLISPHRYDNLESLILYAIANSKQVNFRILLSIGTAVGDVLRFPLAILLLVLMGLVYWGNTTRLFRREYDMRNLANLEAVNWPQISPVIQLNLLKTDIETGPWAMAMTPLQFCKRLKLLEEVRPQRREGMTRKEWDKIEVVLKRGEANRLFALQLGQAWRGHDKLPLHVRALFAVFAARINADSKTAFNMLIQLSASSTSKLNFHGVDELCNKYVNTKLVQRITSSHGYVYTVMASMLEGAREDGVQASADFLWLKPVDRKLWYVLNTVGRQTPFVEVAGVFAHWIAEKEAGRKLVMPMVEEATKALELALLDVVYHPEGE